MFSSSSSKPLSSLFLGCCLAFTLLAGGNEAFQVTKTSKPVTAKEGSTVKLFCRSDSYYEYCTWRHNSDICEYEWKSDHGKVIKQRCSSRIDPRIKFTGNYEGHECRIELTGVTAEDAGEWSCEMEKYVWGSIRGTSEKRKVFLTVVEEEEEEEIEEEEEEPELQEPLSNENEEVLVERFEFPSSSSTETTTTAATFPVTQDAIDGNVDDDDEDSEDIAEEEDSNDTSILDDKETLDYVDSLANDINSAGEISAMDSDDSFPYAAVIAGVFGALFVLMLISGVCFQRRNRKRALEADWKEKQEAMDNDDNIFESKEDEESRIGIRSNAGKPLSVIGEEALDAKLEINPEEQSITYHGSRSYAVNDD